jgi:hypothetical protein
VLPVEMRADHQLSLQAGGTGGVQMAHLWIFFSQDSSRPAWRTAAGVLAITCVIKNCKEKRAQLCKHFKTNLSTRRYTLASVGGPYESDTSVQP